MLKVKIRVKNKFNKIEKIQKKISETTVESVEEVLKNIRSYAIRLENYHNENGIIVDLVDVSSGKIKSRVYADPEQFMSNGKSYLLFEYFGTGRYAEQEHVGKTKHFIETGYTEWYIPVAKAGRTLNYPILTIGNEQFYVAKGAKANHFLENAEFKTRNSNKDIITKKIKEMLKEVCE